MKICFVGSADGIISVPFVLSALIMFMSVLYYCSFCAI